MMESMTASSVLDLGETFHVGIRVPDIHAAMADLGKGHGVTWAELQHRQQSVWTPSTGQIETELWFTYSQQGPVHLELLQGQPGTLWDTSVPGIHHTGVWVADVKAVTERLIGEGWTLIGAQAAPEQGFGAFSYVQSPSGLVIEPVWDAVKPVFAKWWAGGSL
jgi:catechol 2,3-dioxygenase-like lactoylglutathione lyase family enzyme